MLCGLGAWSSHWVFLGTPFSPGLISPPAPCPHRSGDGFTTGKLLWDCSLYRDSTSCDQPRGCVPKQEQNPLPSVGLEGWKSPRPAWKDAREASSAAVVASDPWGPLKFHT